MCQRDTANDVQYWAKTWEDASVVADPNTNAILCLVARFNLRGVLGLGVTALASRESASPGPATLLHQRPAAAHHQQVTVVLLWQWRPEGARV